MRNDDEKDPFGITGGSGDIIARTDASTEEADLLAELETMRESAINSKIQRERQWDRYRYYLQGETLVRDSVTTDLYRIPSDDTPRYTGAQDNVLRPTARAFVGKHIRAIPTASVRPRSGDREDLLSAEVLESFVDYFDSKEHMPIKYKRMVEFLPWAGSAFIQPIWDTQAGRTVAWCDECEYYSDTDEPGDPCPQCAFEAESEVAARLEEAALEGLDPMALADEMGKPPDVPLSGIKEGDVKARIIDPRDFYPDPGANEIEEAQWAFIRRIMPVNVVRKMFPENADLVQVEEDLKADRSLAYVGATFAGHPDTKILESHCYLYEYHEMSSVEYPNGRLIYSTSDRILEKYTSPDGEEENPYVRLLDQLPFFPSRSDRRPGELWGEPLVEQAWPLQRERNKLLTQMRKHRDLTNNPKLLSPLGNGIAVDQMTTTSGEIIKYRHMFGAPKYLQLPPMPSYTHEELARMEQAIRAKFGVTEQEMGVTSGDPSGRYAAILESQSTESVNTIIMENNAYLMNFYKAVLLIAQDYYHPSRKWAIQGQDRVKTYSWDRVKIREGWDVSIREGDSLSRNPALRLQQALQLMNQGVFMDQTTGQPDMKRFWRMAGVIETRTGYDDEGNERTYAVTIPEMIARGEDVQPQPWDNSQIIAEELLGWLRGPGRAGADPQVVQQVQALWQQHMMVLQGGQEAPQEGGEGGGGGNQPGQASPPSASPSAPGIVSSPEQTVQQADQAGEVQAQISGGQEN
jgi:hypothetical protein